ncbi:envelope stress response membrane protein PspB [Pelagibius sp. Alg239-R121]|uniref:envelope stress response membrane protein PspB n=1 Tax=Pelagibius sp. Alg239-R121 TaxID=2993448 RepID=UPI0024A7A2CF|nr:envelope stress response membrane protein PspB [Pelagibius sp. Alg239-R121]
MELVELLRTPLIIFLAVVAPVWIVVHYFTRWRSAKTLSRDDEQTLSELWDSAAKMEDRIHTLEQILDAESPGWRSRQ